MAKKEERIMDTVDEVLEIKSVDGLVAYSDFKLDGKEYKKGEVFIAPSNYIQDPSMDNFRRMSRKKQQSQIGTAFYFEVPPINKENDPEVRRVVLPVQ